MFPLGLLTALVGWSAYLLGNSQGNKNNNNAAQNAAQNPAIKSTGEEEKNSIAKNYNTYNYYTNESENGNTLFGSEKKTKRTLFGMNE